MARAALKWSAKELAAQSDLGWATIQRMESSDGVPSVLANNIAKVQTALEADGISFINDGSNYGVMLNGEAVKD